MMVSKQCRALKLCAEEMTQFKVTGTLLGQIFESPFRAHSVHLLCLNDLNICFTAGHGDEVKRARAVHAALWSISNFLRFNYSSFHFVSALSPMPQNNFHETCLKCLGD